ncbi:MAG: hypothetical protein WD227_13855 [Vicinamibacterales bacterium]
MSNEALDTVDPGCEDFRSLSSQVLTVNPVTDEASAQVFGEKVNELARQHGATCAHCSTYRQHIAGREERPVVLADSAIERLPVWLRWILVLPSAAAAYLVVQLVVILLHTLAEFFRALAPIVSVMGNYFPQLVNSIAGPYAFVWLGARVAPTHKFISAVTLAVIVATLSGAVLLLALASPNVSSRQPGGLIWILITGLIGTTAAIKASLDWKTRRQE